MKNVTDKYSGAIQAFASDFELAVQGRHKLAELDDKIQDANFKIDVELLGELAWLIRNDKVRILTIAE